MADRPSRQGGEPSIQPQTIPEDVRHELQTPRTDPEGVTVPENELRRRIAIHEGSIPTVEILDRYMLTAHEDATAEGTDEGVIETEVGTGITTHHEFISIPNEKFGTMWGTDENETATQGQGRDALDHGTSRRCCKGRPPGGIPEMTTR